VDGSRAEGKILNKQSQTLSDSKSRKAGGEITYVCCIEHGRLERQTLTMIASLRAFGGTLGRGRILCVIGRKGAALSPQTVERLHALGAELVHAEAGDNPAPWFNYANKVAAVVTADRLATTPVVAWLDSDILIADEPKGLRLGPNEDFAARCEHLPPAVTRTDERSVPYWRALCGMFGVDFADVPWIARDDGRPEQKMYFNSGLFAWRRESGFARSYAAAFRKLIRSRIAQHDGSFFTADQVILTPVVLANSLRWRHLSIIDHLMIFQGFIDGPDPAPSMSKASAIHYSKSLESPYRPRFLERLARERPALRVWLEQFERELGSERTARRSMLAQAFRIWRGLRWRWYARRVRRCATGQPAQAVE
jgi:hypothetical protein